MTIEYPLTSDEFSRANGVLPQSVRARVCRFGSYFGIIPKKLANGRLMWPNIQIEERTIPAPVTTDEFAKLNDTAPQKVRHRFSVFGSYYGLQPDKASNGRLMWPPIVVIVTKQPNGRLNPPTYVPAKR